MVGTARASSRAASMPLRSGICRSMTATCGRWSTTSQIAAEPVVTLGHDLDLGRGARCRLQPLADQGVVVGDQDSDGHGSSSGKLA